MTASPAFAEMIETLCLHEPLQARHADLVARLTAVNAAWAETGLAIAHVVPLSERLFAFDEDGRRALIVPCTDERGALIDLAAFDPDDPAWRRTLAGAAWCLGEETVDFSNTCEGALPVHDSLWAYLNAHGEGVVILDHRRALFEFYARGIVRVACASLKAGRRLRDALDARLAQPDILIPDDPTDADAPPDEQSDIHAEVHR